MWADSTTSSAAREIGSELLTADEFRQIFQNRYEYCRVLLELSQQQQTFLEAEDYDGLIRLLQQKQVTLDALQQVSQFEPSLSEQWQAHRDQLAQPVRVECESWLERSETLLAALAAHEQQCTSRLQRDQAHTRAQLAAVSQSLVVREAYEDSFGASQFDMNQ